MAVALASTRLPAQAPGSHDEKASAMLRADTGNPARPPFGLDRVGAPPVVHVELKEEQPPGREYSVVAYQAGRAVEEKAVTLERNPTGGIWGQVREDQAWYGHVTLRDRPDEVALMAKNVSDGRMDEVARLKVAWPSIEADATARPDHPINPVELGTVLVPHDTLLLAGGQRAEIEVAALSRTTSYPDARLKAWFDGETPVERGLRLIRGQRVMERLELSHQATADRTTLHLALVDGGHELWRKDLATMIIAHPPAVPRFGALETKLRYDSPIRVGGKLVDYDTAWDPTLKDVVVFLPNGSRFVFWRW
ncbi:MAG TPA: hypothetical protein VL200_13620, partial [Lacunisphaera sp.]|nr:hypothetical protein [Lacunisphaera sp.]